MIFIIIIDLNINKDGRVQVENSNYQIQYQQKKTILVNCLKRLAGVADTLHLDSYSHILQTDERQLEEEIFRLVIVGEFSRGKSTFINALLGKRILPSSSSPTTAIISKIVYGDTPNYQLYFRDGHVETLDETSFKNLRAPKASIEENIDDIQKDVDEEQWIQSIDYAKVQYPMEFCKNNVEIIDTPGVNDISKERVEITYRFLNQADAAILLLSAKQVLSSSEIAFLKERILGNQIHNIFVVINFKDAINECHYNEVIDYAKEHLAEHLPAVEIPVIFLVSSMQALIWRRKENGEVIPPKKLAMMSSSFEETGFVEFENSLKHFLFTEKGNAKLKKYVSRGNMYVKQLEKTILIQMDDLSKSTDELQEKLQKMRPVFEDTKNKAYYISRSLSTALKNHQSELMLKCNAGLENLQVVATKAVDGYQLGMSHKALVEMIQTAVMPVQKKFYKDIETFQSEKVHTEFKETVSKIEKLWQDLEITYAGSIEKYNDMEKQSTVLTEIKINETTVCEDDNDAQDISVGLAVGGLVAVAVAHPIAILGGLFFGFDNVLKVASGIVSSILSLFSDSPTEKVKKQIKRDLRTSYAERNEKIRNHIEQTYQQQCDQMVQTVTKTLNGKVDDLNNQLQATIKEKQEKEEDIAQKISQMKQLQLVLQKEKQQMNEVMI